MKRVVLTLLVLFAAIEYNYSQHLSLADLKQSGDTYITHGVYFEFSSSEIRPSSFALLDSIAAFLKVNKHLCVEVGNHSDERFSKKYSANYSGVRARSIVDYLIFKGIRPDRLVAKGYGPDQPLIKGAKTEEEHHLNRRTEFTVLGNDCR